MNCLLLLLGAPLQHGRADERVAEEVAAQRRAGPGELLVQHDLLQEGQPLAPVLGRPAGADPAAREELGGPLVVERLALVGRHGEPRFAPALGKVVLQPCGDLGPELLGFGRVGEVHARHGTRPVLGTATTTPRRRLSTRSPPQAGRQVGCSAASSVADRTRSGPVRGDGEGGVCHEEGRTPQ